MVQQDKLFTMIYTFERFAHVGYRIRSPQSRSSCADETGLVSKRGGACFSNESCLEKRIGYNIISLSKSQSLSWQRKDERCKVKVNRRASAGKVGLTLFFDYRGALLV